MGTEGRRGAGSGAEADPVYAAQESEQRRFSELHLSCSAPREGPMYAGLPGWAVSENAALARVFALQTRRKWE